MFELMPLVLLVFSALIGVLFFVRRSWKKQSLCSRLQRWHGGSDGLPGSPRSQRTLRLRQGTHAWYERTKTCFGCPEIARDIQTSETCLPPSSSPLDGYFRKGLSGGGGLIKITHSPSNYKVSMQLNRFLCDTPDLYICLPWYRTVKCIGQLSTTGDTNIEVTYSIHQITQLIIRRTTATGGRISACIALWTIAPHSFAYGFVRTDIALASWLPYLPAVAKSWLANSSNLSSL